MPARKLVKLIVQIPCYNEAETLPATVAAIPRSIPGVDRVELLVIDDGSRDETVRVARSLGVEHIVCHRGNRGLARSFSSGLEYALRAGADIIVNTDGDNQYCGADIAKLVEPILLGKADIVVGDRQTWNIEHFSLPKRILQAMGSYLVRRLSATDVPDAVSGFRAFSRTAAMKLNVVNSFSYTIETLIQAGRSKLAIVSVPVRTNGKTRPSRLFKSIPQFLKKSGGTMLRAYALYRPLSVFVGLGTLLIIAGIVPIARFLVFVVIGESSGHLQSLVLGAALMVLGGSACVLGLLADLIAANRMLLESLLEKVRWLEQNFEKEHFDGLKPQITAAIATVVECDIDATPSLPIVPIMAASIAQPTSFHV